MSDARHALNFQKPNEIGNIDFEINLESLEYLLANAEPWYQKQVMENYSHGIARTAAEVNDNERDFRKWVNPLESRLPLAPHLKIYCFYGIGKATERSYFYREDQDPQSNVNITIDTGFTYSTGGDGETIVDHGVILGEGDGTVPLLSNGYMCAKGWKIKRFNPAGIEVKVYEMPHEPDNWSPRGGPNTGRPFLDFRLESFPHWLIVLNSR